MKLTNILAETRRYTPAVITMRRGTVIQADHARIVTYPSGMKYVVVGIKPEIIKRAASPTGNQRPPIVRKLRDFYAPETYIPVPGDQDESGWCEPGMDGEYDAHRQCVVTRKFARILTINPRNIASIEWGATGLAAEPRTSP